MARESPSTSDSTWSTWPRLLRRLLRVHTSRLTRLVCRTMLPASFLSYRIKYIPVEACINCIILSLTVNNFINMLYISWPVYNENKNKLIYKWMWVNWRTILSFEDASKLLQDNLIIKDKHSVVDYKMHHIYHAIIAGCLLLSN